MNPRTTFLMATRDGAPDTPLPEAESVIVETVGDVVCLELEDGSRLAFDARELTAATRPRAA